MDRVIYSIHWWLIEFILLTLKYKTQRADVNVMCVGKGHQVEKEMFDGSSILCWLLLILVFGKGFRVLRKKLWHKICG